jgi:putative acetyltransferase
MVKCRASRSNRQGNPTSRNCCGWVRSSPYRCTHQSCYLLDVGELEHPDVTVFVARVDGEARGMAALVDKRDGSAELKRLFIDDAARRLGLARQLLERIEEFGGAAGAHLIQLETGPRSFAAIALYESSGYRRIPNFGQYVDDPHSVCMEKELA